MSTWTPRGSACPCPSLLCNTAKAPPPHLVHRGWNAPHLPCSYAVRRVLWSPHAEHLLASCSYDMTVKMWDVAAPSPLVRR